MTYQCNGLIKQIVYKMMLKSFDRKHALMIGSSILGIGLSWAFIERWKRRNHPLVKYSEAVIAANDVFGADLGPKRRFSLLIHTIKNPEDNEFGFSYILKGNNSKAQIVVIGDVLTHGELVKMQENKKMLFKNSQTEKERAIIVTNNKDYIPINVSNFFLTSKNPHNRKDILIPDNEKIWRPKELFFETSSSSKKIVSSDSFADILNSEYTLQTYGDSLTKTEKSIENIRNRLNTKNFLIMIPKSVHDYTWFYRLNFLIIGLVAIILTIKGKKPILNSSPYHLALTKAKTSVNLKKVLGNSIEPLWVRGIVHSYFGIAEFKFHLFGSLGEKTVNVVARKKILNKDWELKKTTFSIEDKEISL